MALVTTTNIGGRSGLRTHSDKGVKTQQADITFQTADYSAGIDLEAVKGSLGVAAIICVVDASIRAANNTLRGGLCWLYDPTTKKLRFYVTSTAAEVAGAAPLVNGDICRVTVLGF